MNPRQFLKSIVMLTFAPCLAPAALLHMQFAGGGSEVTMAQGDSVRVDLLWTMQATDTSKSRLTGVDLRFNVNDVPNPDAPEAADKFIVESLSTPIPGWTNEATVGVGGYFGGEFFLSAIDPDINPPHILGTGAEFTSLIASFVLRKADFLPGATYITFRHRFAGAILPVAYNGPADWSHRFQGSITGPNQFRMGLGNPGDGGPQWDPYHGLELFQPLIIHNVPEPGGFALFALGLACFFKHPRNSRQLA